MRKDNTTLLKKLKRYSALVGPTLAIASVANAQIVYTDVDPDFELTDDPGGNGSGVTLDLDNDGITDFTLAAYSSTSGQSSQLNLGGAAPYSANGNGIMGYSSAPFYYPSNIAQGQTIDDGGNFWSYFGFYGTLVWYYLGGGGTFGQFSNAVDAYMGVRLVDAGGATHYGWVRIDVVDNPIKIILKDFAFESTPDLGIDAGDAGGTPVNSVNPAENFGIFAYDRNVFVQAPVSENGSLNISVTDVTGKVVINQTTNESNVRLSMKNFAMGIYVVKAVKGGQEKTRKVSIQ